MRFVVDTMLGTLAKWMRILGYDVIYDPSLDDSGMLAIAKAEGRTIISRDRELCSRMAGSLLLTSVVLDEQLSSVAGMWPPDESRVLTRCIMCNSELAPAGREDAEGNVPNGVLERHDEFWKCGACGKLYWKGSHWKAMADKAGKVIACRSNPR